MIKMVWIVATLNAQGMPVSLTVNETTAFEDVAACEEFGEGMTSRLEDWARGYLRMDWDWPIKAKHQCTPAGDPA